MTYTVLGEALDPTHSLTHFHLNPSQAVWYSIYLCCKDWMHLGGCLMFYWVGLPVSHLSRY